MTFLSLSREETIADQVSGLAFPIKLIGFGRSDHMVESAGDRAGIGAYEDVPSVLHELDPFRGVAERHTWLSEEVGLFLYTAGIRNHEIACVFEGEHLVVADRIDDPDVGTEGQAQPLEGLAGAGVERENRFLVVALVDRLDDGSQPLGFIRVFGPVNRQ